MTLVMLQSRAARIGVWCVCVCFVSHRPASLWHHLLREAQSCPSFLIPMFSNGRSFPYSRVWRVAEWRITPCTLEPVFWFSSCALQSHSLGCSDKLTTRVPRLPPAWAEQLHITRLMWHGSAWACTWRELPVFWCHVAYSGCHVWSHVACVPCPFSATAEPPLFQVLACKRRVAAEEVRWLGKRVHAKLVVGKQRLRTSVL